MTPITYRIKFKFLCLAFRILDNLILAYPLNLFSPLSKHTRCAQTHVTPEYRMLGHNSMTLSQLSKYGPQTNKISITWELLRNENSQQLSQTYLSPVIWRWDSAICVLTSIPSNSDGHSSLRTTAISPIQLTKSYSDLIPFYIHVKFCENT